MSARNGAWGKVSVWGGGKEHLWVPGAKAVEKMVHVCDALFLFRQ